MDKDKIANAVSAFLDRVEGHPDVRKELAEYLIELTSNRWPSREVEVVYRQILSSLPAIADVPPEQQVSDDGTEIA